MKYILLLASFVLSAASSFATVTLDINIGGLENSSGQAANGMSYAIVVDTDNNGFNAGSYIGFDITTNGQFLSIASGVTDDWFVFSGTQGTGQTPPTTSLIFPADGSVGVVNDVEYTNLSQGDEFAVIWFPGGTAASSGDDYGFFTDTGITTNMVIPADSTQSNEPTSISTKSVNFQVVPEPSTLAFFGLFGFIFLFVRRRPAV